VRTSRLLFTVILNKVTRKRIELTRAGYRLKMVTGVLMTLTTIFVMTSNTVLMSIIMFS